MNKPSQNINSLNEIVLRFFNNLESWFSTVKFWNKTYNINVYIINDLSAAKKLLNGE